MLLFWLVCFPAQALIPSPSSRTRCSMGCHGVHIASTTKRPGTVCKVRWLNIDCIQDRPTRYFVNFRKKKKTKFLLKTMMVIMRPTRWWWWYCSSVWEVCMRLVVAKWFKRSRFAFSHATQSQSALLLINEFLFSPVFVYYQFSIVRQFHEKLMIFVLFFSLQPLPEQRHINICQQHCCLQHIMIFDWQI